jgi:FkbM family methyltransferase
LVLDIGAHQGAFSEMILRSWPAAEIYAFEPIPAMTEHLAKLARRHAGLTAVAVALGADEIDGAAFNVHSSSASSSLLQTDPAYGRLYPDQAALSEKIRVRVRRLDDWAVENAVGMGRPVDLVKIDVQGFEDRVLQGGEVTLRRTRYLVTEAALYPSYDGGVMLDDLCARLRALSFELIWGFNVFGASADLFWRNRNVE